MVRGASLQGPWEYVASDKLPAAFAQIPADYPRPTLLTFIAGPPGGAKRCSTLASRRPRRFAATRALI